eukprot:Lankesteria_metandrocarpae@DN5411_c0_g1_i1.p1
MVLNVLISVASEVIPFLDTSSLFRWMLTSKRNWNSVLSLTVLEEHCKKKFFEFIHGNFDWKFDKWFISEQFLRSPTIIRAKVGGSNPHDFDIRGRKTNVNKDKQHVKGMEYDFTIESAPKTRVDKLGAWLTWRRLYTEVRQSTFLLRDCSRGYRESFDFGDEKWVRLEQPALNEAVCHNVVSWPDWQVGRHDPQCDNYLVDVSIYLRTDKYSGEKIVETQNESLIKTELHSLVPNVGDFTENDIYHLAFMVHEYGPSEVNLVVPPKFRCVESDAQLSWQLKAKRSCKSPEQIMKELSAVFRKVEFVHTFVSANSFPIIPTFCSRGGQLARHGLKLVAAKIVQESLIDKMGPQPLEFLQKSHSIVCESMKSQLQKQPLNSKTVSPAVIHNKVGPPLCSEESMVLHRELVDKALDRGKVQFKPWIVDTEENQPSTTGATNTERTDELGSVWIDVWRSMKKGDFAKVARDWRFYYIEQIRLAILRTRQFYPYADGTLWEMSLSNSDMLPNKVMATNDHNGDCNLCYIGPEAVLIMRFHSDHC